MNFNYIRLFFVISALISFEIIFAQSAGISGMPAKTYHWFGNDTSKLVQKAKPILLHPPVFGKKRRNNGMILPLPFGAGINFFQFNQDYKTTSLELSNYENDNTYTANKIDDNTNAGEMCITVRPDFWLFPFLNVYGLFGYTNGYTNYDMTLFFNESEDNPQAKGVHLKTSQDYSGPVYGFGVTGSTGYKGYFIILNYEYSVTRRQDYKEQLKYQYFRAKAGILLGHNERKAKGALWAGTAFMADKHYFEGLIPTETILPGTSPINGEYMLFTGNTTVRYHWNLLLGGMLNVNDHNIIVLEVGFMHRTNFNVGYTFRF